MPVRVLGYEASAAKRCPLSYKDGILHLTKYQRHQNNHTRLGRFLRDLGEETVAVWWKDIDEYRQGGWYGGEPDPADAQEVLALLQNIRAWATQ